MTVFAYRDTFRQGVSENTMPERIMTTLQSDTIIFTPDGEINEFTLPVIEILYGKQFTDTAGNIYPYSDEDTVTAYGSCSHDFVSGTASEHSKKSDGSCEGEEYHAQRCSICGYVVKGERICAYIKDVCPHE